MGGSREGAHLQGNQEKWQGPNERDEVMSLPVDFHRHPRRVISQSRVVKVSVYFIHRLYSDYLYFASSNKSADDFHEKVTEALQLFENCMLDYSLRACVYNNTLNNAMPVRILEAGPLTEQATWWLLCRWHGGWDFSI